MLKAPRFINLVLLWVEMFVLLQRCKPNDGPASESQTSYK